MSTAHAGDYCQHKDKMILTKLEARTAAALLHNEAYKCKECGGWHTASRLKKGDHRKRSKR